MYALDRWKDTLLNGQRVHIRTKQSLMQQNPNTEVKTLGMSVGSHQSTQAATFEHLLPGVVKLDRADMPLSRVPSS
jgi:hypothetical protein